MRKTLLREVFEDNMRMMGKEENNNRRGRIIIVLRSSSIFFLAVIIYLFLSNFTYLEHSFLQYGRLSFAKTKFTSQNIKTKSRETQGKNVSFSQYSTFLSELELPLREIFGLKVKTIIIDPGHGGEDPGAIGKLGTEEKNITLDIAKRLRERLKNHKEYQILLTREDDMTLPLENRIEFANIHGADLYISIHVNYIPRKPINIIETYYFGSHTDKETLRLAEKENKGSQYTLSDFKEIIQKIENTLKTQESRVLALSIQKSLYGNISKKNKKILDYGIKTAPFVVLLGVDVPSVLTEVACLSNRREEKKLNQEHYREEISRYLEEGIVSYLNKNSDKGEVQYATKRDTDKE